MGGARTALFNWLFARHHHGTFILRIEDTDTTRSTPEHAENLCRVLRVLGLHWDEGPEVGGPHAPYHQSARQPLYVAAFEQLRNAGSIYPCYCTPDELEARREAARLQGQPPRYDRRCLDLGAAERQAFERQGRKPAWRLRVPDAGRVVVSDLVKGEVGFDAASLDDFIVVRSDGSPTYNFAVVVDDIEMQITHVLRGDEHLANTPKQLLLYQALGTPPPAFGHLPMILAADRTKLSKRHGSVAVEEFLADGLLEEAILNYCALLGWSPPDDREVLSLHEIVESFSLERVNSAAAVYDLEKLRWMNAQHLRRLTPKQILHRADAWLRAAGLLPPLPGPPLDTVIDAVTERVQTLAELPAAIEYFYRRPTVYDPDGAAKYFVPETAERLRKAAEELTRCVAFDAEQAEILYRALADQLGIKAAQLIHPTRLALTGRTVGPSLFHIMALLGRDETTARLRRAADWIISGGSTT